MRSTALIAAGVLLGASLFAGCGSDDGDKKSSAGGGDYCETLKSSEKLVTSFTGSGSQPDFTKFQDFLDTAKELGDEAPSSIKDDWKTLNGGMDSLKDALKDAGLTFKQFGEITSGGQAPEGVDPAKLAAFVTKVQALGTQKFSDAADAINDQAKKDCKVDLSGS